MFPLLSRLGKSLRDARRFLLENHLDSFPLRRTLGRYSVNKLRKDTLAGVNVALLAVPQGMAYALVAGLDNVAYGIIGSAIAALVGPLFAASRHTILGPTNATALMLFGAVAGSAVGAHAEQLLPVLVLMAGLMLVVGAYFRFADLIQYISRSVVVGYVTGAGFLIMASQLRDVLAQPAEGDLGGRPTNFFALLHHSLTHEIHLATVLLSLTTLAVYLALRKWAPRLPGFALTLVGMCIVAELLRHWGIGDEIKRLKSFGLASLLPTIPDLREAGTMERIGHLFGPAFALAFLCALESSVMSKGLASKSGDRPDPNQDLLSVGMANLACAFFSRMPASGSLTRSALNFESGAVTQVASLISGMLCAVGALLLGGVVGAVPRCCLAVLIIAVAASLINRRQLRICLRATRSDATTLVVTIAATLLMPLHVAIFVGVATSIVLYLRKASRPMLVEYEFNPQGDLMEKSTTAPRQNPQISIVHVEGELFFGAAELFRTQIQRTVQDPNLRVIILRMKNARHLDATSVMALEELIRFLRSKNRHLIISGASKEVYRVLKNSGMIDVIERENFFMGSPQNPNLSTRNALKRAQELLGGTKADVRIFYDPQYHI